MFPRRIDPIIALAALLAFTPAAGAENAPGGRLYCCTDSGGKYVCGDILPRACYGRAYRELGSNGRTLREVAAPLTDEQRTQRVVEQEERRKEAMRVAEQARKDQALLETYDSLEDIEKMRKRALGDVRESIRNAETRIAEIKGLRKKYEDEAEFYKKKTVPPDVEKGLADTEFEIKAQESIVEAKRNEEQNIQTKYDEDRQRFLDLQQRNVKPR